MVFKLGTRVKYKRQKIAAYHECFWAVSVDSVDEDGDVYVDDIAGHKGPGIRDPVAHLHPNNTHCSNFHKLQLNHI